MSKRACRGSALILSLWATATLAAISIAQATRVSLELKWTGRMQEARQADYTAWTGLALAIHRLGMDDELRWDAPQEEWAQVPANPVPFAPGSFLYRVSDEQARIPLNAVAEELLATLPGFTPQAATELVARRNEGKWVTHLAELSLLASFNLDSLDELEPLVTVQEGNPVNLNTASANVLTRLGLSPELARRITEFRNGADGAWGTPDDGIFSGVEQIYPILENHLGPLLPEDQTRIGELLGKQLLDVRSSFFRVEVEGRTARHGIVNRVTAIVERGATSTPRIRRWHET